jgi:hypothetical protein
VPARTAWYKEGLAHGFLTPADVRAVAGLPADALPLAAGMSAYPSSAPIERRPLDRASRSTRAGLAEPRHLQIFEGGSFGRNYVHVAMV